MAAALSFGFVYVHPFKDGKGRLHRWLIHHVLAIGGFNPPSFIFPISAAMLLHVVDYRKIADMPDCTIELLHRSLRQGSGRLPRRARRREFASLTDEKVARLE